MTLNAHPAHPDARFLLAVDIAAPLEPVLPKFFLRKSQKSQTHMTLGQIFAPGSGKSALPEKLNGSFAKVHTIPIPGGHVPRPGRHSQ
jgi:hypothetical protein